MRVCELKYPYLEADIRNLKVGDLVRLHGRVFTGRDCFHKWIVEGHPSPCDMRHGTLFHCGPVVLGRDGSYRVLAAGPTTSMREEPYQAQVIEQLGLRLVMGKGGMGALTLEACRRYGCVYVQAVGGAASLLASRVKRVETVYLLDEFGSAEAVWVFDVEGLNGLVTMDTHGQSLYAAVEQRSREALAAMVL